MTHPTFLGDISSITLGRGGRIIELVVKIGLLSEQDKYRYRRNVGRRNVPILRKPHVESSVNGAVDCPGRQE